MEVIRRCSQVIAQLSAEICCMSVWLEDKTQTLLLVGSIVRKMVCKGLYEVCI